MKENIRVVTWQLRVLMARRNVKSAAELARLLEKEVGYKINPTHLTRYKKDTPPQLSLDFLSALLTTLDADLDELFEVKIQHNPNTEAPQATDPPPPRKRRGKALPVAAQPQGMSPPENSPIRTPATATPAKTRKKAPERPSLQIVPPAISAGSSITGPKIELFPDGYDEENSQ